VKKRVKQYQATDRQDFARMAMEMRQMGRSRSIGAWQGSEMGEWRQVWGGGVGGRCDGQVMAHDSWVNWMVKLPLRSGICSFRFSHNAGCSVHLPISACPHPFSPATISHLTSEHIRTHQCALRLPSIVPILAQLAALSGPTGRPAVTTSASRPCASRP
jgi:hypothetical protein